MNGAGCLGKIGYRSMAEANQALGRVNARRKDGGKNLRAYHCACCGQFHLGRRRSADTRDNTTARKVKYRELTE